MEPKAARLNGYQQQIGCTAARRPQGEKLDMSHHRSILKTLVGVGAMLATATVLASPADRTASGSGAGFEWEAQSRIVGFNPTAGAGDDPRYHATGGEYTGVVALIMDFDGALFICSGSLLPDGYSILTAAHCVTDGSLGTPTRTTAYFYGGDDPNYRVPFGAESVAIDVSDYFIAAGYTGQVIDQNDLAVLRLGERAPEFAKTYDLYDGGDLTGQEFNVAGYGGRSTVGGNLGADSQTGFLRQGDNRYEWYLDDPDFAGFWDGFFGSAESGRVILSDFDNGLAVNDTGCLIAAALGLAGDKYCNTGLGLDEVGVAGGDSGGPQFVNGMIASVTSFGLSFGTAFGDIRAGLNSSFGEFSGYVPVSIHADFIRSVMLPVPEPGTLLMLATGLLALGYRRRRMAATH